MNIEQQLGIKLSVLVAGLIGGIVSLTYEEKISFNRAVLLILAGASTAAYLQPLAEHYINIPENLSTGLGFVLGLVSMRIIDVLMVNVPKWLNKYLKVDATTNNRITTTDKHDSDGG